MRQLEREERQHFAVSHVLLQEVFVIDCNVFVLFKSIQIVFATAASHFVVLRQLTQNGNHFLHGRISDVIATPVTERFANVCNSVSIALNTFAPL